MRIRRFAVFAAALMVGAIPAYSFADEVNVSVDVGNHGSVNDHSTDYTEKVAEDASYSIKIKSDDGYEIHSVLINDEPVSDHIADPVEGQKEAEITVDDVGGDMDVSAVFRATSTPAGTYVDEDTGTEDDSGGTGGGTTTEDGDGSDDSDADNDGKDENNAGTDGENGGAGSGDAGAGSDQSTSDGATTDPGDTTSAQGVGSEEAATYVATNTEGDDSDGIRKGDDSEDTQKDGDPNDTHKGDGSPKTGDRSMPPTIAAMALLWSLMMTVAMKTVRRRS